MVERDQVLALIKGETKEVISWTMGFFDEQLAKELLGEECIPSDILPSFEFCHGSSPRQDWEAKALFAERAHTGSTRRLGQLFGIWPWWSRGVLGEGYFHISQETYYSLRDRGT